MRGHMRSLGIAGGLAILALWASQTLAQAPSSSTSSAKPAAIVNGEPISMAELEAVVRSQGPTAVKPTEQQQKQMRRELLEMLMDDLIMQQFLRANAPRVDPSAVDKKVAELAEAMKKQGKTLADYYRETGQSEGQVRVEIAAGLQWQAYAQNRVTEEVLKRYFEENRDFFDQVTIRASHIVLRVPANASEGELQTTRQKLLVIRQDIISGKVDFAEAAKKNSQCPSAPQGGDLVTPFHRKGEVDEAFAKAAFALKVGEISDVVQSDYGLHLIKVTERGPGTPAVYEQIKDGVRKVFSGEMYMAVLAQQRKAAKIDVYLP